MSESTSGPAAPADGGAAPSTDTGPVIGPAPASQPAITVTEAARLLNQQRRQAKGPDAAPEAPSERKPSPNDAIAEAAKAPAQPAARPPAAKPADTGLSALERALGVPAADPAAAPAEAATIEVQGQRYSPTQLQEFISKATDYTRKTQALADQQRQVMAQQQALATVLPYLQPELARLQESVAAQANKPDIALMQTDPQRYFMELHQFEAVRAEQERLGNLQRIQTEAQARATEQQVMQGHEQLAREFPFWANPQDRAAAQQQIKEWATTKGGFQETELSGLADPRALKAMMKAMMFDRWVSASKTAAPMPQMSAPARGMPPPPAPTERVQRAEESFDARPNVRNAAQLLAARRSNGSGGGFRH